MLFYVLKNPHKVRQAMCGFFLDMATKNVRCLQMEKATISDCPILRWLPYL